MGVSLLTRARSYAEPIVLLSISIFFLPYTLLFHPLLALTSPSTFRSKWFENMWNVIGPKMAASPLQVDHIDLLLKRAHGTVLELGPGAGDQSYHFKPVASHINHIYGAEPNAFLHAGLIAKGNEAGLAGKYTALECGAQPGSLLPALKKAGLIPASMSTLPEDGVFDSIIAIKSLCSAPQSQLPATMAVIQALLKPGGEFLFFEHLANNNDRLTIMFAWWTDLIWPLFMGGCRMDGKLDRVIGGMGGWKSRDLVTTGEHLGHEPFRYVRGICRKV